MCLLTGNHRCEACGKLAEVLNETEDYSWVCNDCIRIYNELLKSDGPDCNIDDDKPYDLTAD